MKLVSAIQNLIIRFRYPISLPEDVAEALGIPLPNTLSFADFVKKICDPDNLPTKLSKNMSRESAEEAFKKAVSTERFSKKTLISYDFREGCIEFILQFDEESRLRRLYLLHKDIKSDEGLELTLAHSNY